MSVTVGAGARPDARSITRPVWARRTLQDVARIGDQNGAELGSTGPDRRIGFRHVGYGGGALHEHALGAAAGYRPVDRDRFSRPRLSTCAAARRPDWAHDELDSAWSDFRRDRPREATSRHQCGSRWHGLRRDRECADVLGGAPM